MRRHALPLVALLALLAACAPKPAGTAGDTPRKKRPPQERLPANAVLWEGELPEGVDRAALLDKDGVLTRTKEPTGDTVRWWPYSVDYWGLTRTDLETLLEPHVGRTVRVTGHYKKIYSGGTWIYEVDPVKITALADVPAK
jgi:hypothetical protein